MRKPRSLIPFVFLLAAGGCAAPTATLDLISVGRQGLASAREAQVQQHQALASHAQAQAGALDAAFDADVRLAAAGRLATADGKPAALTPEWVISARKGYAAARDAVAAQAQADQAAHQQRLDNLAAADEALQMAADLTTRQWNLSETVRQQLLAAQRKVIGQTK